MTKITVEDIVNDIFLILKKYFDGYVEMDHLNARGKTREKFENLVKEYYDIL